jgi:transposase
MQKPKSFCSWQPEQTTLLPPSQREWLSEDHQVYFLLDLVDELDLSEILIPAQAKYPRWEKGFDPRMLTTLLLYAYCVGIVSFPKIERACYEALAFRVLTGNQQPDHSRISEFRSRNLDALNDLYRFAEAFDCVQILRLCQKAGMVSLGHLAMDATNVQANASKHKAMSHERMLRSEQKLEKEIDALIRKAEILDVQEDQRYGKGNLGSELPDDLCHKQGRLAIIRQVRKEMEAETAAAAAQQRQRQEEAYTARAKAAASQETNAPASEQAELNIKAEASVAKAKTAKEKAIEAAETAGVEPPDLDPLASDAIPRRGLVRKADGTPTAKTQRNFSDPDSHLMQSGAPICRATTASWLWTVTTR